MSIEVISEAKRCLQCKNPRCSKGCPVGTPIKEAINLLLNKQIKNAGQMLFENNPLSVICSLVCPRENQCEGHCVLGIKGKPVSIGLIENYISDYYLNNLNHLTCCDNQPKLNDPEEKKKVAIIGSGPSGLTIAVMLLAKGYDITIFEGHDKIGGVLRYGIPEFRLPNRILDKMHTVLTNSGVKIRPNTTVGMNLFIDDLFRDGFKSVFIGTGVWKPSRVDIKGESLGHVHYAIDYLKNPDVYNLGKKVAIIGTGNVAMDVARTALRHDAEEVFILSRGSQETIKARQEEYEMAKVDGTEFLFNKMPKEFKENGVLMLSTEYVGDGEDKKLEPIENSEELLECDSIIISIGQGPRSIIAQTTKGIDLTTRGLVAVDEDGRTTRDGVFASGDVVTGAKTVVGAVNVSKRVADAIDAYIKSLK